MGAPVAILAKPDDHRGILTMAEAVNAMIEALRNWAQDPLVAELRRRTHTPKNVRITLHQGAAPAYGTTGIMAHAELVRTHLVLDLVQPHGTIPILKFWPYFSSTTRTRWATLLIMPRTDGVSSSVRWRCSLSRPRPRSVCVCLAGRRLALAICSTVTVFLVI